MNEMNERKQKTNEQVELLMTGCVYLILIGCGVALILTALFIGSWILS